VISFEISDVKTRVEGPKIFFNVASIYAPYEPDYCSEAIAAIEDVMAEIRKHLKRANIDQPVVAAEALAKSIPSKAKGGVGDVKRQEVCFLILSGLPHAEVVKRSGVSSGTVSLIRSEMREVIPLYRNSESGLCVPFACRLRAVCVPRDRKFRFRRRTSR
jgi:hypothetical protein